MPKNFEQALDYYASIYMLATGVTRNAQLIFARGLVERFR